MTVNTVIIPRNDLRHTRFEVIFFSADNLGRQIRWVRTIARIIVSCYQLLNKNRVKI